MSNRCRGDFAGVFAGAEEQRRCRGAEVQMYREAQVHRCRYGDAVIKVLRC